MILTGLPHSDHLDQQDLVAVLVHDVVVTDADAIHRVLPPHRDAGRRSGILREALSITSARCSRASLTPHTSTGTHPVDPGASGRLDHVVLSDIAWA